MPIQVPHSLLTLEPSETYREILRLISGAEPGEDTWYARWWAADALTLMGDYESAIGIYPPPTSSRATMQVERLLSLKVAAGFPYEAADAVALLGPRVTKYGRDNIGKVRETVEELLELRSATDRADQLQSWANDAPQRPYQVYLGSSAGYQASKALRLDHYQLSKVPEAVEYCRSVVRQAENIVRQSAGIPRVGEGWVSETQLAYELRAAFPNVEVVQHASPEWLGRQHLDVYIPAWRVAVEYQGPQHDGPVDFFGGEAAYEQVKKRDLRKRRLCIRHGVALVYVRPGYELAEVLREIAEVKS